RKKTTISRLNAMRASGKPITVLTAYDYPTALRSEAAGIDMILVGDSLAQVALGYDSTTRLTLEEMIHHSKAVARGTKSAFLVVDMPFGTYTTGVRDAVANAVRLVKEGGAEAVKMEGGEEIVGLVKEMTRMGIPVMGHIGLMPQRHTISSGYRVQGKSAEAALSLLQSA
ncbi:ketopantoate hydroxymethyltransferase, partial [Cantharellus anzutake]|uniref:ketopantoate hydroxymethyltransferase n=1 Tax=Cantharellus anzutake TaxID=1750568 RepID=UPI001903C478